MDQAISTLSDTKPLTTLTPWQKSISGSVDIETLIMRSETPTDAHQLDQVWPKCWKSWQLTIPGDSPPDGRQPPASNFSTLTMMMVTKAMMTLTIMMTVMMMMSVMMICLAS